MDDVLCEIKKAKVQARKIAKQAAEEESSKANQLHVEDQTISSKDAAQNLADSSLETNTHSPSTANDRCLTLEKEKEDTILDHQ